jgi:asparagine synthase (glutamine-hydrolysing)
MCGICGFSGGINVEVLQRMTQTIYHRGPDEDGYYSDGSVNFGMRRLSIVDLATGQQPIHNERKSVWTIFNGEIYNYRELRTALEKKGHQFYTDHSDTELIVHLYEDHSYEFCSKINGMFAIALWDSTSETLTLARDRLGVKPLFYTIINGQIVFGSEIKAILAYPGYIKDISYEGVYHYFTFKNVPAPYTAFSNIFSLLPGEMVHFSGGQLSKRKWWTVQFAEQEQSEEEIKSRILSLLEDATRLRMQTDVPFGAYLSGGVDSSTVVALMTRFSDKPIKTFSLGYKDELKNKEADIFYARKASQVFKTEHYEYFMTSGELRDDIADVLRSFDQPFSGTISTYFLSKLIRQHVKVALSGDGADELFGSYLSHRTAMPMFHYKRVKRNKKSEAFTEKEKLLFAPCDENYLHNLFEKSNGDEASWRYALYQFPDEEKNSLLSQQFLKNTKSCSSFDLIRDAFAGATSQDPLNRILEMELNTQFPDQVLAFVDYLSMAHSVEVRSPFIDYRLVEYAATIPGSYKIKNGNVKDILKKTVDHLLPDGITKRPKEGFVLPIFDWMTAQYKDYSLDLLSKQRLQKHGFFNESRVEALTDSYHSGNKVLAGRIWNMMMFQVWWEEYFG